MADITAMALLKADLGFYGSQVDAAVEVQLGSCLDYAARALNEAKITLIPGDVADAQLQAMYAAWIYRKRVAGTAKPPMLQEAIRNRQVDNALAKQAQEVPNDL